MFIRIFLCPSVLVAGMALLGLAGCTPARPAPGAAFKSYNDGAGMPVDAPYGVWNHADAQAPKPASADAQAQIEALESIGYLDGSVRATETGGVTCPDPALASPGVNFYTSGHAPEAVLMDLQGNVLHTWRYELKDVWPDYPFRKDVPKTGYWRRAALLPDGSVLAIFEGIGIIKIDRDSKLIWAARNGAHHDLEVLPDGRIWVLTRIAHVVEAVNAERPILEDFATLLDADGQTLKSFSLLAAFEQSPFRDTMWGLMQPSGDVYHANAIAALDGRLANTVPAFAAGRLLVSLLYPNTIAVFDPDTETAVWMQTGSWKRQHHARVTQEGRIGIFDNRGAGMRSRIVAVDPATGTESVLYEGNDAAPFYSWACGSWYRLPNGNLLVNESDRGRSFEVAPDGTRVWTFVNPHRAGPDGEYIAGLFDLVRYPEGYFRGE